jgi:hypothetical protein
VSGFVRLVLDEVFGPTGFLNQITWKRQTSSGYKGKNFLGKNHDDIFLYGRSASAKYTVEMIPYSDSYVAQRFSHVDADTGRRFKDAFLGTATTEETIAGLKAENRIYYTENGGMRLKVYLDEAKGIPLDDIWTDINFINSMSEERVSYPTQKPEALLERIIKASSNEGDVVLDPFCGCGTTVNVAERLNRRWIGIDITHLAIALIKKRLHDSFGPELAHFEVIGEPADATSAAALAEENRHQFEWWALGMVDAAPAQDKKKGADRGVDGVIYFQEKDDGKYHKIVVQVKSGHATAAQVRDLKGVMEREKAAMAALITLKPPTKPMKDEAAAAGYFKSEQFPDHQFPRLQIVTIAELFAGKTLDYPRWVPGKTFKRAARRRKNPAPEEQQRGLL